MTRGGARNRSGPQPDPLSGRSEARGLKFDQLPAEGFQGDIPEFSLPGATGRELDVWGALWRTPQAAAWAREPWRIPAVEMYTRYKVRAEEPDSPASLVAGLIRFKDQIGLTPAGLRENGWQIVGDGAEPSRKRADWPEESAPGPKRRLRAVPDGA